MSSKAAHPFWLDGSYDRECVEACHYHPAHNWITLRLGDVLENPRDPDERMVICSGCFAPRCGDSMEPDPLEVLRRALDGASINGLNIDDDFDAVHASPPCQHYSRLSAMHPEREYPDLIDETRSLLQATGLPWVIENVEGAPLASESNLFGDHGVMLCGSMFGLGAGRGYLRRHRLFETSFPVAQPECDHQGMAVGVYGHGGHSGKHRMLYRAEASEAMEIDWMTRDEMCQAIPPAYTRHVGSYLLAHIEAESRAAA